MQQSIEREGGSPSPMAPTGPAGGPVRLWKRLMGVSALLLTGGVAAWAYSAHRLAEDARETLPPESLASLAPPTEMMVTTEPVTFRPVQRVVEAVGTLCGFEEIVISAKVEGRVLRLHHEVADRVPPEEVLVELDPVLPKLAVDQAESTLAVELAKLGLETLPDSGFDLSKVPTVMLAQAKLENAQAKMDRSARLSAANASSKGDVENTVAEFRTAQADHTNQLLLARSGLATIALRHSALMAARQQLADSRICVPRPHRAVPGQESGVTYVVIKRAVSEGTFVRVGDEICRLAIDKTLKLRVPVPERYSPELQVGQPAEVFTAAFAAPFGGTVTLINPSVDRATRTFEVEIQVANGEGRLKTGSFAKGVIQTSRTEETPTVPVSAVVTFAGVTKLFLLKEGRAAEVLVTSGLQTRDWVEILSPRMEPGGIVITSGQSALANQTAVRSRGSKTSMTAAAGGPEAVAIGSQAGSQERTR